MKRRWTQGIQRWTPVLVQTVRDVWANNGPEWAAALAFYAVLSLFPLLIAGTVVASYLGDPIWAAERFTSLVEKFLPRSDVEVRPIVEAALLERRRVGILAVVIFLVTGRRVLGALTSALSRFSDADERQDRLKRRAVVEFGLFAGVAVLFMLALLTSPLVEAAWETIQFLPAGETVVITAVVEVIQAVVLFAIVVAIYAFVPPGKRYWRPVLIGAALAGILFYVAQAVFLALLGLITETLRTVYAPLASAALLLVWTWYVAMITLLGGAAASHVKVMVIEGHSEHEAERRHVSRKPAT
ncbi:MAG: YihY/virulence factor BrkB family protein [Chloroflexota bacterium]|nr:YihY/virulence factor BrkB family protein [Chloroflexota bacterium]